MFWPSKKGLGICFPLCWNLSPCYLQEVQADLTTERFGCLLIAAIYNGASNRRNCLELSSQRHRKRNTVHRTQATPLLGHLLTSCCAFTYTVGSTGHGQMTALTDETGQSSEVTSVITPELINGIKTVMGVALLEMHPLVILQNQGIRKVVASGTVESIFQGAG